VDLDAPGGTKAQLLLDLGGGVRMELVHIKPGIFITGDGQPGQRVEITKGYYIGKYEVTCGQLTAFVRATGYKTQAEQGGGATGNAYNGNWGGVAGMDWRNPNFKPADKNFVQTDDYPVTCVSWNDAKAFCDWVAKKTGRAARLPTEAEWEYACRARTVTKWSWGDDESKAGEYAWTGANAGQLTHPVGQKKSNGFGLYDMHGNVWEWCQDWWGPSMAEGRDLEGPSKGDRRCIRGGSWWEQAVGCRSAFRNAEGPSNRLTRVGFRVASQ
jgi:formylglycine-generating enzyme required for sulfatase activity